MGNQRGNETGMEVLEDVNDDEDSQINQSHNSDFMMGDKYLQQDVA